VLCVAGRSLCVGLITRPEILDNEETLAHWGCCTMVKKRIYYSCADPGGRAANVWVCGHSFAGMVGSNPTYGQACLSVCCECCVLCRYRFLFLLVQRFIKNTPTVQQPRDSTSFHIIRQQASKVDLTSYYPIKDIKIQISQAFFFGKIINND
jgi:hypothetical protein